MKILLGQQWRWRILPRDFFLFTRKTVLIFTKIHWGKFLKERWGRKKAIFFGVWGESNGNGNQRELSCFYAMGMAIQLGLEQLQCLPRHLDTIGGSGFKVCILYTAYLCRDIYYAKYYGKGGDGQLGKKNKNQELGKKWKRERKNGENFTKNFT